jgi:hypothetical protein
MIIKNTTKWNTADLRKLFSRCIKEIRKLEGRGRIKGIRVDVKNGVGRGIWGRAWTGYYQMTIKLGRDIDFRDEHKIKQLAKLFIHEYYHNLGFKNQDYANYKYDWTERIPTAFVHDYQIRLAEPKVKPQKDLQLERYQKIVKKVGFWERKLKLARTFLKKYQAKQRYYERVLVASGKIKK